MRVCMCLCPGQRVDMGLNELRLNAGGGGGGGA